MSKRDDPLPATHHLPEELRKKLLQDLTAGRTVALPASELARADIRENLDQLLTQLHREAGDRVAPLEIAGYTVLGEIGHGGMSTVYLARHEALDRCVALKVMPNWLGGQERARERVLREARAMARLSHPNIVTVHDIVDRGETIAIAMEWVDGLTLADLLRALPTTPTESDAVILRHALGAPATADRLETSVNRTFVRMMVDIARAVHCVHQNGLLHLDIKPSNVLVRRDGTALLADFGVVREVDLLLTHTGSFAGTPIYAAPEQLNRATRTMGPATDVYGLGMTLYELLARFQPLRQEGLTKVLQDIQAGRIPPLGNIATVADDLANIVHKAIAVAPEKRYASAAALADDLQAFLDGRAVTARPLSIGEKVGRWVRAEPWKALLATTLAVLLPIAGGLGFVLVRESDNIAEGKRLALHRQVAEVTNGGFQDFLERGAVARRTLDHLLGVWRLDQTDPGMLATLLIMMSPDYPDEALAIAAEARSLGLAGRGLDLTEQRLRAKRIYFTASEAAELRSSTLPLDVHLRILDRVAWASQTHAKADYLPVAEDLDTAVLVGRAPSPLLLGLRAWCAAKTGDTKAFDESRHALAANWPQQAVVNLWPALGWIENAPGKALELARSAQACEPDNLTARGTIVGCLGALGRFEEAAALAAEVPESRDKDGWWANVRAKHLAEAGRRDEALAALRPPTTTQDAWPDSTYDGALGAIDPEAQKRLHESTLAASDRPPLWQLIDACRTAIDRGDRDASLSIARRGFALFPEIPTFRWRLCVASWSERRHDEAAKYVDGLIPPDTHLDGYCQQLARTLAWKKDWTALLQLSDYWLRYGKEEMHRVHYWRGIALLRLGKRAEGLKSLDEHIRVARELDDSQSNGKGRTYAQVQYEKAWAVLDPQLPPTERYPQVPPEVSDWHRPVVLRSADRNAWFGCIVAHLHAAEGNRELALERAEAARKDALDKPSEEAPAELPQMLDDLIQSLQPR
jgi:serine/threonine protein kinase